MKQGIVPIEKYDKAVLRLDIMRGDLQFVLSELLREHAEEIDPGAVYAYGHAINLITAVLKEDT